MVAYYNDNDKFCAAWLRRLISAGHLPMGDVDERPIEQVSAADVRGYSHCHFFAGIGGWAYALKLAQWPDDRPVWTGSCPCQPFSVAGQRKATTDQRHLWPRWLALVQQCNPAILFGEQVAGAIGWRWLDIVLSDLERQGYACGAAVLPACGVGAPHIRQRCWFVADADQERGGRHAGTVLGAQGQAQWQVRDVGDGAQSGGAVGELVGTDIAGLSLWTDATRPGYWPSAAAAGWHACEWFACSDGKSRPVEPGTFPLAHGIPGRVGRLGAYGNAIVPQVAAEFIKAAM